MIIKRNIMLIGSMGSGKSHFGRNLAERKGWQFVDTDRVLEGRFGLPIAEIFKKIGEKAFRRAEMDVLKKVCLYHEAVISVGGNFPIEHRTLKVLKKYSYIIGIRAAQFRIVSRVNRRIGKRPTMDYNNVHAFVHAMIQSWKPVYKQCDFVLDTTNGRTYDFMQRIEDELVASGVQFKARRQPNDMDNGDDKESSQELKLNNSVTRNTNDRRISKKIDAHKRTSHTLGSNKVVPNKVVSTTSCCDKHRNKKTSNQTGKGRKSEAISKQHTPQRGNGYEKSRNTNKRRRRTWHERRHQSAN
ncbi:shikimate kinase [uncultured Veillonella sp.]|uniref:shikimate kinase n=1 Tax=uncultured Veillonella sp. TaxID=159268 RepID=UPI002623B175|nr:shikimate kinase [uncultured Veillonella sp.]